MKEYIARTDAEEVSHDAADILHSLASLSPRAMRSYCISVGMARGCDAVSQKKKSWMGSISEERSGAETSDTVGISMTVFPVQCGLQ